MYKTTVLSRFLRGRTSENLEREIMDIFAAVFSPALLLGLIGFLTYMYFRIKHRGVPPGPSGVPFLGYAPFLGSNPQDSFLELGKKYGNVFSLYMGPKLAIVLNDYEAIKSAFIGQADTFTGRTDGFVFRYLATGADGHIHGLPSTEGEVWKTSRRFALQTLRDLGMGKSTIQERILDESEYMAGIFRQNVGKAFDPTKTVMSSVSNVVCALCFGKRYPHDHPTMKRILEDLRIITGFMSQAGPLQAYPWLRFLPIPLGRKWKEVVEAVGRNYAFIRGEIQEHKDAHSDESRDYINAFLTHQKKDMLHEKIHSTSAFSDYELDTNVRAFFGAGTETTSITLLWTFLYMMHHPDIQEKVQKEIDNNTGHSRSITVDDRVHLPYTEAVIRECQRLGNVTPLGVLRANREETELLTYRIPSRCYIIPNFASVNLDPTLWKDPAEFRPERFLDSEGKLHEPPHFMPFSIGKRACVGEALARMEIFLFFANIMQRFTLAAARGTVLPPTDQYVTGISCRPLPFRMDVVPRRSS